MEADRNEFREESGQKRRPCIFSREVLSKLDTEQLDKVADALMDEKVSNTGISRVVSRWTDIDVHEQSVRRHRNKTCGCYAR